MESVVLTTLSEKKEMYLCCQISSRIRGPTKSYTTKADVRCNLGKLSYMIIDYLRWRSHLLASANCNIYKCMADNLVSWEGTSISSHCARNIGTYSQFGGDGVQF